MEHVKNFLTGLAVCAVTALAVIGVFIFWKLAFGTALIGLVLVAIYGCGWAWRHGDDEDE